MLVTVGFVLGGLNAQNSAQLPLGWNTLYYLARLGRATVERLIQEGRIQPALKLIEAKELLAQQSRGACRAAPVSILRRRVARFASFIRNEWPGLSDEDRRFAHGEVSGLVNEIGNYISEEGVTS